MSMSISCAATQLRIQLLLRAPLNARAIDQLVLIPIEVAITSGHRLF